MRVSRRAWSAFLLLVLVTSVRVIAAVATTTKSAIGDAPANSSNAHAENLRLPAQVPYLNPPDRAKQTQYFLSNGLAGVLASPNGHWHQIIGPGYGGARTHLEETIELEIDGQTRAVNYEVKRARGTGVYYALGEIAGLHFELIDHTRLVDHARPSGFWLVRSLRFSNTSNRKISLVVRVHLQGASSTIKDAAGQARGYRQGNVAVALTPLDATATADGNTLNSPTYQLPPGGTVDLAVMHDATGARDADILREAHGVDHLAWAARAIADWQEWFTRVPATYRLDRIAEARARDLVEGGLVVIKSNQSGDGGFMATPTMYNQGYVRDGTMGLRGLAATGHFQESRQWLEWVARQFTGTKAIANWWGLAPFLTTVYGGGVGNWDFEQTSLFVLTARDYFRATGDLEFLRQIKAPLQYCIDAPQRYAATHEYRLLFQGDETEICFAVPAGPTGIGHRGEGSHSYPSAASFGGALQFFSEFETAVGLDPRRHVNTLTKETVDLVATRQRLLEETDRLFWRTDVPSAPAGFHDAFRRIDDHAWPVFPIVDFTLQPIYWDCPFLEPEKKRADVAAVFQHFDHSTGRLALFPGLNNGFCGHTLGFLLWGLLEVQDPRADSVYAALVNGPTVSWLGYWNEAYNQQGEPFTDYAPTADNGLRTMETGVNVSALARYWDLGGKRRTKL